MIVVYIILFIILHMFLVNLNTEMGIDFYTNNSCKEIHDIFSFLPDLSNNIILLSFINLQVLFIFLLPFKNIKEFLILFIFIMIIRHIFVNLTILPSQTEIKHSNNNLKYILGGDYDKIFSGHFAFGFLLTLLLYKYQIITNIPLLIFYNLFNAFALISTKSHYTIDIAVSLVVTLLIFITNSKALHLFKIIL